MCFLLFAGTTKPIPRKQFNQAAPDLCVEFLSEGDSSVKAHFSMPEVQYIGSTSHCGCDFPHLIFQNGGWPGYWEEEDSEAAATRRQNQEGLVNILRELGVDRVELYGIWAGHFSPPKNCEEISVEELLKPDFYFKEQGFYKVKL